jgi:hypothetical protein
MAPSLHGAIDVKELEAEREHDRNRNTQQKEPNQQAHLEEAHRLFTIESPSRTELTGLVEQAVKKREAKPGDQVKDDDADGKTSQDGKHDEGNHLVGHVEWRVVRRRCAKKNG